MKSPLAFAATLALAVSSIIYAQAGGQAAQQPGSPDDEQQDFLKDAASGNSLEIQEGQFIAEHTQNQQVKQFAQTLVQDHQKAQQQLKQAAQQAGLSIKDELTPVHKAMLQELQQKSGKDLDRAFAFSAVADHHKDILEYTFASQNLQNAQLKQYASQCIPVLQQHFRTAEDLSRSVAGVRDFPTASQR